jgi:exonuclease III
MSILSWNCRGLGQPSTVQELSLPVRKYCPKIVFISETRQQKSRVLNLRFRLGYKNAFVVDRKGKVEGLVIYWNESTNLSIMSYGSHYIDTLIWDNDHNAN